MRKIYGNSVDTTKFFYIFVHRYTFLINFTYIYIYNLWLTTGRSVWEWCSPQTPIFNWLLSLFSCASLRRWTVQIKTHTHTHTHAHAHTHTHTHTHTLSHHTIFPATVATSGPLPNARWSHPHHWMHLLS